MADLYAIIGAVVAALLALGGMWAKGRSDGARSAEIKQARAREAAREASDNAATEYRSHGAAERLRDGRF